MSWIGSGFGLHLPESRNNKLGRWGKNREQKEPTEVKPGR